MTINCPLAFVLSVSLGLVDVSSAGASTAEAVERPLLVTVDDLPIGARTLHPSAEERLALTRGLLAVLERHAVRAVGFVVASDQLDDADREALRLWRAAGHELGNHTASHRSANTTARAEWLADAEAGRARLAELTGRSPRFFRFPMLREGANDADRGAIASWLAESGQRNLRPTIDTQDWSFERPWVEATRAGDAAAIEEVRTEYLDALRVSIRHHERTGDRLHGRTTPQILLLHANAVGAANWGALFDWLVATGHRFVGPDELLADQAIALEPSEGSPQGLALWDRELAARRRAEARHEIETLLAESAKTWSAGEIEGFCADYAENALFVSPTGLTEGRQAVQDRYLARYPDRAAMGRLRLEPLRIELIDGPEVSMLLDERAGRVHGASVVARWSLDRDGLEPLSGLTLIVMRRGPDGWQIVADASM